MDSGTHNSESRPGRDSNLGPPYHVYNRTKSPKIYSQNTLYQRSTTDSKTDHEQYLNLTDWSSLLVNKESQKNHQLWSSSTEIVAWQESQQSEPTPPKDTGRLIQNLIHEPSESILLEEIANINHTLSQDTPLSWLIETFTEEL